jgi:hypothetical protein
MSGVIKKVWKLPFCIIFSSLISMSCLVTQQVQRFDCEASGGTWKYDEYFHEYNCINTGPEYIQKYFPQLIENETNTTGETTIEDDSSLSGSSCDASQSLQISTGITKQEINQYGTHLCEYQLTVTNTGKDIGVWVSFYQHDIDGYAHTEKSRWIGNILVEPGGNTNWAANVYLYDDADADGPLMSVPEKISAVINTPECAEERINSEYLDQIAIPVDILCPLE